MVNPLTQDELQSILAFTVALARSAGELILEGSAKIRSSGAVDEKKNSVDLVTEYDVAVERLVKSKLSEKYPDFKFIGEESFAAGSRPEMTDEPTFCVDPIDGTTNFIHGFPHSCISLGLISFKRPVLGVIYNPFLEQLYTATKGGGAFLAQGMRAPARLPLADPPRPLPSLSQALIGIEWGSDRSLEMVEKKGESFKRLAGDPSTGVVKGKMAHSLRSLGSAALNYGLVAQGGMDFYWEIGTWPWDICAGAIIAQEAGCLVAGSRDAPLDNDVNEGVLWGRKHMVIRKIGDSETEKGVDAQRRLIKEFYDTVEDFEPK
ncbi:myo inositol monophosphatase [Lentinus tigrinus ALCF2SS1-7]|uniref:Inositol-1-monophosphatase n=1 Tax=Lentinus tigrinus ALCF2SS1-6 TaxID=1328759 RepID=A0A5C2SLC0_9APHY|nr:myo inositol monophosphatase [Lentinus tigrinus ALCF2SS1-6]RPD82926.1 myo inositol monophosphatase [Lentinus tigrinus ALCF2SS1-7]